MRKFIIAMVKEILEILSVAVPITIFMGATLFISAQFLNGWIAIALTSVLTTPFMVYMLGRQEKARQQTLDWTSKDEEQLDHDYWKFKS